MTPGHSIMAASPRVRIGALKDTVQDAMRFHFPGDDGLVLIRLHYMKDEAMAA